MKKPKAKRPKGKTATKSKHFFFFSRLGQAKYSTGQLKGIQIFLALISYSEEIFCWNFQIRILRRFKFDVENFITSPRSNDEISSFFRNFQLLKKDRFFSSWEKTQNQTCWNLAYLITIKMSLSEKKCHTKLETSNDPNTENLSKKISSEYGNLEPKIFGEVFNWPCNTKTKNQICWNWALSRCE